jgi:hypothetical protein
MRRTARDLVALVTAAALCGLLAGCSSNNDGGPASAVVPGDAAVSDFALADVNPTSSSFGVEVSPRHYLGAVSAWYFGHST